MFGLLQQLNNIYYEVYKFILKILLQKKSGGKQLPFRNIFILL